jgi:hypothetical protein
VNWTIALSQFFYGRAFVVAFLIFFNVLLLWLFSVVYSHPANGQISFYCFALGLLYTNLANFFYPFGVATRLRFEGESLATAKKCANFTLPINNRYIRREVLNCILIKKKFACAMEQNSVDYFCYNT